MRVRGCPESVGSWIIPSTEVTHTLGKGAGVKILERVNYVCVEIIAQVYNKHQNHNHRQRPHMVQHKKSQYWIKRIIRIDMQVCL